MSAATSRPAGTRPGPLAPSGHRQSFAGLLASEWVKFWSVRSVVATLAVAVICTVGLGVAIAALSTVGTGEPAEDLGVAPDAATLMVGAQVASLLVGAVGAIVIGNEYSSGSIRTTLAVVPRRLPVLLAKALTLAGIVLGVLGPAVLLTFVLGQAILAGQGIRISLSDPDAVLILVGNVAVLAGTALCGLGLGALLRNSAAAICLLVGLLFVVPLLLLGLPGFPGQRLLATYNLSNTTAALTSPAAGEFGSLSVTASAVAFTIWVVVLLAGGAVALLRRDA